MKHWKAPDEGIWYTFVVDGKRIGTVLDSAKCQKEIKRVRNLKGVSVEAATDSDLVKAGAKTDLPKRIIDKMRQLHRDSTRRFA